MTYAERGPGLGKAAAVKGVGTQHLYQMDIIVAEGIVFGEPCHPLRQRLGKNNAIKRILVVIGKVMI